MVTLGDNKREISDLFIRTGRIQYIVMSLILFGFIVFGKPFIILWAGLDYADAYIITLLFFIALLIPLIQNLGITILQARNQMMFRSVLYIIIAAIALVFQIILSKHYGGLGCAIAIAGALLIGQGIIMNIYYCRRQNLDVLIFWKEILKMSFVPIITSSFALYITHKFVLIDTWEKLVVGIFIYSLIYIPLFYAFSMNNNEKKMVLSPLKTLLKHSL